MLPEIKNQSENIRIRSIVGRFLEHPRVYVFGKEDPVMYISSADLMTRNTENRVEIATPILDEEIKNRILNYLEIQLKDNVGARTMNSSGEYEKISVDNDRLASQKYFIEEAEARKNRMKKGDNNKNNIEKTNSKQKKSFLEKIFGFLKNNRD